MPFVNPVIPSLTPAQLAKALRNEIGNPIPDRDTIRSLIDHGADIDAADDFGMTPLLLATLSDNLGDIAAMLIELGADITARDNTQNTALHFAVMTQDEKTVGLLLDRRTTAGFDIDATDKGGVTPLRLALEAGSFRLVEKLLAAGASPAPYTEEMLNDLDSPLRARAVGVLRTALRRHTAALGNGFNTPLPGIVPLRRPKRRPPGGPQR